MKIAAIIFALFGILHLEALVRYFPVGTSPHWPLVLFDIFSGILYILVAAGIWTRRIFAWYLGFGVIVLITASFLVGVCLKIPVVSMGEKAIIVCLASAFVVLFIAYWSSVWFRQRKWFVS
jgi:hypothetical protein